MEITGILLAGGQSRRYGSPKAFAELEGKFFYEHVYEALGAVCSQVIIVTRPELTGRFPAHLNVMTDTEEAAGQGPLAGIYSAMNTAGGGWYLVLPCDMPYVTAEAVHRLMQTADRDAEVSAVRTMGEHLPLFSMWNGRVKDRLGESLHQRQLGVMEFLRQSDTKWIESGRIHADDMIFCNINKPDDQREGGRQT